MRPPDGSPKVVGLSIRRIEDERLLTGRGRFTDNLRFEGQAYAAIVRSPHAHAEVLSIGKSAAETVDGVLGVFVAADLEAEGIGPLPFFSTIRGVDGGPVSAPPCHALAKETVRHVGDPVAVVVASAPDIAREAADLVDVSYRPHESVTDAAMAIEPSAPQLWLEAPGNVAGVYTVGDERTVTEAMADAAHIIGLTLINNRIVVVPMEPRTAIGVYEADKDQLVLYCGNQAPHLSRGLLAAAFGIAKDRLRIVIGDIGGGFGAKIVPYREDILVLFAARRLRRPVLWRADRSESFLSDTHGRDQQATVKLGLDYQGRALAYHADVLGNMGAYLSPFGSPIATTTGHRIICGVYDIPQIFLRFRCVLTNSVPTGPYRGAGRPEVVYRLERLFDAAARTLGLDPAEIRRRNLIRHDQIPYRNATGWTYDSGDFVALLDHTLKIADWSGFSKRREQSSKNGKLRGRGLACHIDTTSGIDLHETATLHLDANGEIELLIGTQAMGQGLATAYTQIAADHLHLSLSRIRVFQGDTGRVPDGGGSYGSRSLYLGGSAVQKASITLSRRLIELAAKLLEAESEDLTMQEGRILVVGTDRFVAFAELAAKEPEGCIRCTERVEAPYTFPNGCYVAEVEIDPQTGLPEIVQMTAVDDVGHVVNPMIVHGQVHGGLAQGIGQALWEHVVFDASGQLLSGSLMDYALPRAAALPKFVAFNDESWPSPNNPLGSKGAGESGAVGAPPAVVAAILDALAPFAVHHLDMPITAEKIWRAIYGLPPWQQ
jgi:aerobic carbon-monoxide dehydrogenase large subunit